MYRQMEEDLHACSMDCQSHDEEEKEDCHSALDEDE